MQSDNLGLLSQAAGRKGTYGSTDTRLVRSAAGLSTAEAAYLLELHGPNELETVGKKGFFLILLTQMGNLIFLLTGTAATICYATGDFTKGTFLLSLVCIVCLSNAIGEYSGQDPSVALKAMAPPTAKVVRDGVLHDLPVGEIVPGDVVHVRMGDLIAADMVVIEAVDLAMNEAVLTGEPHEANKRVEERESDTAFKSNMLYKSTDVVSGSGICVVTATGMSTEVGLIAKRLKPDDESMTEGLNPLGRSINSLGKIIGAVCAVVITTGTVLSIAVRYQDLPPACRHDDLECICYDAMVRGLLMAVAIIPHGLPLVVMVMLRIGSQLMAKKNAVVTRQSAVDYLGATQVICTDKTGTLTEGKMAVTALAGLCRDGRSLSPTGAGQGKAPRSRRADVGFYPLKGLNPEGGVFAAASLTAGTCRSLDRGEAVKGLQDLTEPDEDGYVDVRPDDLPAALIARASLAAASINCHSTVIKCDSGGWRAEGNMSEAALKVAAYKGHLEDGGDLARHLLIQHPRVSSLEVPFNSSRKMNATIHELPSTNCLASLVFDDEYSHYAIVKGAPDRVLPHVKRMLALREGSATLRVAEEGITAEERVLIQEQNKTFAERALRSILMAVQPLRPADVEALRAAEDANERLELLQRGPLTFLSMWGIFDPPRSSVPPSIKRCHEAGIRVVMITGDQRDTAVAIGKLVGIMSESQHAELVARPCADMHEPQDSASLPGMPPKRRGSASGLPRLTRTLSVHDVRTTKDQHERKYKSADVLEDMTSQVCVWSRAMPTDKVAIVDSLVKHGNVSAMTGDGVNDAPALKHAEIGVAMGIAGTAVTKNAADMILMDDDFSTIVEAIAEGRKIYGNVQKYVIYNLCVKGSECACIFIAILASLPTPIQGLPQLVNLVVTHIVPPMALAWEDAESYTMRVPPRDTKGDLVVNRMLMIFRWVPFVFGYCVIMVCSLCVFVWMHTGFVNTHALAGSPFAGAVANDLAACEYAGRMVGGRFARDPEPFHCRCHVRSAPWQDQAEVVDQWGRVDFSQVALDPWTGSTGGSFQRENTPFDGSGFATMLERCGDHRCWRGVDDLPTIPGHFNCATHGTRLGRTMTYVSMQLGEVLALATFRTEGFFGFARFSWAYACVLLFNLAALFSVLYVEPVSNLLEFAPLTAQRLALACVGPVLLVLSSEFAKSEYRNQLSVQHAMLGIGKEQLKGDSLA